MTHSAFDNYSDLQNNNYLCTTEGKGNEIIVVLH